MPVIITELPYKQFERKQMKCMPPWLLHLNLRRVLLITIVSALMMACANDRTKDEPPEPSFQERVSECSKIGDRSERNRCLYGD